MVVHYAEIYSAVQVSDPSLRVNCDAMLSREQKDERSVATGDDSSNAV
jgi:hypothetical protein